jgi:RNA polymerase sigma-70 factor (ECF subfamily)
MGWFGSARPDIDALVEAHYVSLYRYAVRLSGAANEAEDLTQETYCQAQKKLHQLREADKAKSWLFTILRNVYLHRLRSTKQERHLSLDSIAELPERSMEPLTAIDSAALQKALNQLPESFRTPIILYYFEEFSYKEIAEQMDVPLGTVMSRLARAKAFLRERLTDRTDLAKVSQGEVL